MATQGSGGGKALYGNVLQLYPADPRIPIVVEVATALAGPFTELTRVLAPSRGGTFRHYTANDNVRRYYRIKHSDVLLYTDSAYLGPQIPVKFGQVLELSAVPQDLTNFVDPLPAVQLDAVATGAIYGKVRTDQLDGGLITAGAAFADDFSLPFPGRRWIYNLGTGSAVETQVTDSLFGGKVLRCAGAISYYGADNMPFDPNVLYCIRWRVRQLSDPSSGAKAFYLGILGVGADGTTLVAVNGANQATSQHYFAADNNTLAAGAVFAEYIGYFKGTGGSPGGQHADPKNPGTMHANVRFIRPIFYANWNTGVGGQFDIDVVIMPASSAAGLKILADEARRRTDTLYLSDGVLDQDVLQDGQRLIRHYQEGYALDGDSITLTGFINPPAVFVDGGAGLTTQPDATKWSPAYNTTKAVHREIQAKNITAAGFDMVAKLKQPGTATPQSKNFAGTQLDVVDETDPVDLGTNVPAFDDAYHVSFDYSMTLSSKYGDPVTGIITYAIDVNDGSGWVPRRVATISRTTTSLTDVVLTGTKADTVTVSGLGANDDIRLRFVGFEVQGLPKNATSAWIKGKTSNGITWNTATDNVASATPDTARPLYWKAIEYA